MQEINAFIKAARAATLSAAVVLAGCVQAPGSTTTPTTVSIYHHATWVKGERTYLDVWTRGVQIVTQPWLGDPYAAFYLGGRWEQFPYNPDYDHIDVIPEPGYAGPDKLVYGRTGEVVVY